jgi:hypothetical protein
MPKREAISFEDDAVLTFVVLFCVGGAFVVFAATGVFVFWLGLTGIGVGICGISTFTSSVTAGIGEWSTFGLKASSFLLAF